MASNVDTEILKQFCAITGASKEIGVQLLEACGCNLDLAIGMHMDGGADTPGQHNGCGPSAGRPDENNGCGPSNQGEDIRAPIPQRSETLVEDMPVYGFRGKRKQARSVFDGFRDFQAEARQQEEMLLSGNNSVNNKKRTLEDLFRPPIDITFKGTFSNLKDAGNAQNKWLLVNVQNVQEFVCQALNRDVWSNSGAKAIIKEHFVFWQVYHDTEEGKKFCQFYKVNQWPFVAIVDPRTGENMSTWNKLDAHIFCELVTDFLNEHPFNKGSESSSPAAKRARREPSIVDATEDEQIQAALKASLTPHTVIIDSDSDIETFSGSEDEDDNSFSSPVKSLPVKKSSSPVKSSPNKNNTSSCSKNSCDDNSESESTNNRNESRDHMNSISSDNSEVNNTSSCDNLSESHTYYLGKETDPQTSLMIRFPDGRRQQLVISCKSKLMALVLYVAENGFSNERYELVTNFPRRKLSYMDFELTLEDVGLHPQESVFVQAR